MDLWQLILNILSNEKFWSSFLVTLLTGMTYVFSRKSKKHAEVAETVTQESKEDIEKVKTTNLILTTQLDVITRELQEVKGRAEDSQKSNSALASAMLRFSTENDSLRNELDKMKLTLSLRDSTIAQLQSRVTNVEVETAVQKKQTGELKLPDSFQEGENR